MDPRLRGDDNYNQGSAFTSGVSRQRIISDGVIGLPAAGFA
jgi:hypothetical protein